MKKWKPYLIFAVLMFGFSMIIAKLFSLQIQKGEYYEALALGQQISFEEVDGWRGAIFFNDGKTTLAATKKKIIAYVNPAKLTEKDQEKAAEELTALLDKPKTEISLLLAENKTFKTEITEENFDKIKTGEISGVSGEKILTRTYPQKQSASQVIGFVNTAGQGQYGIEGYFNDILKGEPSLQKKAKAPDFLSSFLNQNRTNGKGADIVLTLDKNIQYFAEKLLNAAQKDLDFDSGQVIVEEPSTGRILVLATWPDFDLNQFSQASKNYDIFLNSAVQKLYEPGSVFKPITMAGGLEENLIEPETEYEDTGKVELGGPPIHNFEKRIWGKQTITDVLEESINTGAIFVEQKLGSSLFLKYIEKFGFFEKTGIELQGEVASRNDGLRNGYPRDFASASFGQGVEITSLQLVRAFSAIANAGLMMKPYIVEKIILNNEEKITRPKEVRKVISENASAKLTAMLVSVVRNGAARKAQIPGYYIAAKTGTAQVPLKQGGYSETETIQSCISFFPALNPRAVIYVRLDNPQGVGSAGSSAVPLVRDIVKYLIDLWQIPPDFQTE